MTTQPAPVAVMPFEPPSDYSPGSRHPSPMTSSLARRGDTFLLTPKQRRLASGWRLEWRLSVSPNRFISSAPSEVA